MISGKEAAEYLNITTVVLERYIDEGKLNVYYQSSPYGEVPLFDRAELAQLNREGHIIPIEHSIDREFELVSMPSTELLSEFLLPFAELSEMALFDRQELAYFGGGEIVSEFLPTCAPLPPTNDNSSSIVPTDNIQTTNNPLYTTQKESRTTKNSLDNKITSIPSTGLIDVFLLLCARSMGNLIHTLTDKSTHKTPPAMLKGKLLLNLKEAQILSGLSQRILMDAIKNHELPFQFIAKTYLVKSKDLEQFVDNL